MKDLIDENTKTKDIRRHLKADAAYRLFRHGFDTLEIAKDFRTTEADAVSLLAFGRWRYRQAVHSTKMEAATA